MASRRVARRWAGIVALLTLAAGCTFEDPRKTMQAVKVPSSFHEVAALRDAGGKGRWALLSDDDGCTHLVVTVGGRREVSGERCPRGPFDAIVAEHDRSISFNDRKRPRDCDDDGRCAAMPTDVRTTSGVVYGRFGPMVDVVCAPAEQEPLVLRREGDGVFLAAAPVDRIRDGVLLSFLADGRMIGPDPPRVPPDAVASCRASAGLPTPTQATFDWTLAARVPDDLRSEDAAMFVGTDTGHDAGSIDLDLLAEGGKLRVTLHEDSAAIRFGFEGTERDRTQTLALPPEVTNSLRAGSFCPEARLTLDLTDHPKRPLRLSGACG